MPDVAIEVYREGQVLQTFVEPASTVLEVVVKGPQGSKGDKGDKGDTGPRWLNHRGAWVATTAYVTDDGVLNNGTTWRALRANTGVVPVEGLDWTVVAAAGTADAEAIRDVIGLAVRAGTNMQVLVDDVADTITFSTSALNTQQVRDLMGTTLKAGANVQIAVDAVANTITVSSTDTNTTDPEVVRDTIGAALRGAGSVTITVDDVADTITVSGIDTNTTDPEVVRDTIGAALRATGILTLVVDDVADTITLGVPLGTTGTTAAAGNDARIVGAIQSTEKGALNGVATLGPDGKLPTAQVPSLAISEFMGNTVSEAAMVALSAARRGDWTVRTDFTPNRFFILTTDDPTLAANWVRASFGGEVTSVNGQVGTVQLTAAHVAALADTTVGTDVVLTAGKLTIDPERVQDIVAAFAVAGANVTLTYDDIANTFTIAAATDPEVVRDTMGVALRAGTNMTIAVDDALDTITLSAAGTSAEDVRDIVGATLRAGTNVTIAVDDVADTITISASGGSGTVQTRTHDINGAWQVRGTQPAGTVVFWLKKDATVADPPIDATYMLADVDLLLGVTEASAPPRASFARLFLHGGS